MKWFFCVCFFVVACIAAIAAIYHHSLHETVETIFWTAIAIMLLLLSIVNKPRRG
jgi:hypothetical protein